MLLGCIFSHGKFHSLIGAANTEQMEEAFPGLASIVDACCRLGMREGWHCALSKASHCRVVRWAVPASELCVQPANYTCTTRAVHKRIHWNSTG